MISEETLEKAAHRRPGAGLRDPPPLLEEKIQTVQLEVSGTKLSFEINSLLPSTLQPA